MGNYLGFYISVSGLESGASQSCPADRVDGPVSLYPEASKPQCRGRTSAPKPSTTLLLKPVRSMIWDPGDGLGVRLPDLELKAFRGLPNAT